MNQLSTTHTLQRENQFNFNIKKNQMRKVSVAHTHSPKTKASLCKYYNGSR